MSTVTLALTDTHSGGVSVHSDFKPAAGRPLTPALAQALDLIGITHTRWGKTSDSDTSPVAAPSAGLMGEHWGDPAP